MDTIIITLNSMINKDSGGRFVLQRKAEPAVFGSYCKYFSILHYVNHKESKQIVDAFISSPKSDEGFKHSDIILARKVLNLLKVGELDSYLYAEL